MEEKGLLAGLNNCKVKFEVNEPIFIWIASRFSFKPRGATYHLEVVENAVLSKSWQC